MRLIITRLLFAVVLFGGSYTWAQHDTIPAGLDLKWEPTAILSYKPKIVFGVERMDTLQHSWQLNLGYMTEIPGSNFLREEVRGSYFDNLRGGLFRLSRRFYRGDMGHTGLVFELQYYDYDLRFEEELFTDNFRRVMRLREVDRQVLMPGIFGDFGFRFELAEAIWFDFNMLLGFRYQVLWQEQEVVEWARINLSDFNSLEPTGFHPFIRLSFSHVISLRNF